MKQKLFVCLLLLGLIRVSPAAQHIFTFTNDFANGGVIPDGSPVGYADTRTISLTNAIQDVNLKLSIAGGYNGDLYAYVVHSSGFAILLNRPGRGSSSEPVTSYGYSDAGLDITLDDQATGHSVTNDIHLYRAPGNDPAFSSGRLTGTWQPDARYFDPSVVGAGGRSLGAYGLGSFTNVNANGTWTLYIADMSGGAVSTLTSWELQITTGAGTQTITFGPLANRTYGDAPFSLSATASSGLPVSFNVQSGPASLSDGTNVNILAAGSVTIRASQAGDVDWNAAANVDQSFTVNPAALGATADNKNRVYGAGNPTLTVSYSGFVNGDDATDLSGGPILNTGANTASPVGNYPITISQNTLSNGNYTFNFTNGTVSVTKAPLTVTANNASRKYSAPDPAFTASYTGFVNGQNDSVVFGSPSFSNTASNTAPVGGGYVLTPALGTLDATNYAFTSFVAGSLTITAADSATALVSGGNPSLPGANVNFTATLTTVAPATATPAGDVVFEANGTPFSTNALSSGVAAAGNSSLPHGSNTVTAIYAGDSNINGSSNSVIQVVNTPPVAGVDSTNATPNTLLSIPVAALLANDSDADFDTLSITAVSATSTNGGTVALVNSGTQVNYTAANAGADSFSYTLSDTFTTVTGTVLVNVQSVNSTNHVLAIANNFDGTVTLTFIGTPSSQYYIQTTTNMSPSITWDTLTDSTNTAGLDGLWQYTTVTNTRVRFFRSAAAQ